MLKLAESKEWLENLKRIQKLFRCKKRAKIKIFDNKQEIEKYIGSTLGEWVKSLACENGEILITKRNNFENEDMYRLLLHEYIHILINKTFCTTCPVWLNEGLAVFISGQMDIINIGEKRYVEYYSLSYEEDYFYEYCAWIVKKISDIYGIEKIINKAKKCENFTKDKIFREENLKLIQNEAKK